MLKHFEIQLSHLEDDDGNLTVRGFLIVGKTGNVKDGINIDRLIYLDRKIAKLEINAESVRSADHYVAHSLTEKFLKECEDEQWAAVVR